MLSSEEEGSQLREILANDKMKYKQAYYVINKRWWSLWEQYVDSGGQRPGPVDNEELMCLDSITAPQMEEEDKKEEELGEEEAPKEGEEGVDDTEGSKTKKESRISKSNQAKLEKLVQSKKEQAGDGEPKKVLRPGLVVGEDIMVVPTAAFKLIKSWYGVSPVIKRTVIPNDIFGRTLVVELYPLELRFVLPSHNYRVETYPFSRKATLNQVRMNLAMGASQPPYQCEILLITQSAEGGMDTQPLSVDMSATLEDLNVMPDTLLMFKAKSKSLDEFRHVGYSGGFGSYGGRVYTQPIQNRVGTPPVQGATGLSNLGNTCYMNASLQCLANTVPLANYFVNGLFEAEINETNVLGSQGTLVRQFGVLMQELWGGQFVSVAPRDFKGALGKVASQFGGFQQQDAQELLSLLLDGLHEDVNRVQDKPLTEQVVIEEEADAAAASAEAWQVHLARNNSFFVDTFHGQLKSTVACPECDYKPITFDPYMYLSLPLPVKDERLIHVPLIPWRGFPQEEEKEEGSNSKEGGDADQEMGEKKSKAEEQQSYESFAVSTDAAVRYGVRVAKSATVVDVVHALSALSGVEAQNIVVCERYGGRVFALSYEKRVSELRARGSSEAMYAFVVPNVEDGHVLSSLRLSEEETEAMSEDASCALREDEKDVEVVLEQCLDLFMQREVLGKDNEWYCSRCEKHQSEATKEIQLTKLPSHLIIHLKRFQFSSVFRDKIDAMVHYPLEGLNMGAYLAEPQEDQYELYGVARHFGGMGGGHYVAYVKNAVDGQWYDCNDSSVRVVEDVSKVVDKDAYVLFYRRSSEHTVLDVPPPIVLDEEGEGAVEGAVEGDAGGVDTVDE